MVAAQHSILVLGRTGQVGSALSRASWPRSLAPQFYDRGELDLADPVSLRQKIIASRPRFVINAAAYTAVDEAETAAERAFAINRDGPAALAEACQAVDAALIHLSTDYIFDGKKAGAYVESDAPAPLSVYGASKAAGEQAVRAAVDRHVILRTSWVYAPAGRNFLRTMLRLGAERDRLSVVDDQHGSPTAAADIAAAILGILSALAGGRDDGYGTFHFCGQGVTSWYGFAQDIFAGAARRGARTPRELLPIATESYPTPAHRPRNSVLDCARLARDYGIVGRPWRAAVSDCLDECLGPVLQSPGD